MSCLSYSCVFFGFMSFSIYCYVSLSAQRKPACPMRIMWAFDVYTYAHTASIVCACVGFPPFNFTTEFCVQLICIHAFCSIPCWIFVLSACYKNAYTAKIACDFSTGFLHWPVGEPAAHISSFLVVLCITRPWSLERLPLTLSMIPDFYPVYIVIPPHYPNLPILCTHSLKST